MKFLQVDSSAAENFVESNLIMRPMASNSTNAIRLKIMASPVLLGVSIGVRSLWLAHMNDLFDENLSKNQSARN